MLFVLYSTDNEQLDARSRLTCKDGVSTPEWGAIAREYCTSACVRVRVGVRMCVMID